MFLDSRKRKNSNTTLEERKWLINHAEENSKLTSTKLALDFSSKFNRTINRSTVSRILTNKQQIKDSVGMIRFLEEGMMNLKYRKKSLHHRPKFRKK